MCTLTQHNLSLLDTTPYSCLKLFIPYDVHFSSESLWPQDASKKVLVGLSHTALNLHKTVGMWLGLLLAFVITF